MLTALAPQYQCSLCREFDPEYHTVAQSWKRAHPDMAGVFFTKLDFGEGRPIFMRVKTYEENELILVRNSIGAKCMGVSSHNGSSIKTVPK